MDRDWLMKPVPSYEDRHPRLPTAALLFYVAYRLPRAISARTTSSDAT
jgi:hypothetical protein